MTAPGPVAIDADAAAERPATAPPARPERPDAARRRLGAYYTPESVADFMADWTVRHTGEHVLEPSFGDGIFLHAIARSARRREIAPIRVSAVEIDEATLARAVRDETLGDTELRHQDFLEVAPFRVQAVIGNPPYVRLRSLTEAQRERALEAARMAMGSAMESSASVWMPFVLHAMEFLDRGGRLALVLPYELTYVRYARPLWRALADGFGSLRVLRSRERLFPDLLQDVVILLADDFGATTETVRYQAFESVADLLAGSPIVSEEIRVDDLVAGSREFVRALLAPELRELLGSRIAAATVPARERVTFNIGYVTGDKTFFHPREREVREYELPARSLRPALTSGRAMAGAGLRTSAVLPRMSSLFLPDADALTSGERRYIEVGEKRGVAKRYKCRIRNPWYVVPGTRVPDVVVSVFSERPLLMMNDGGCFASNSLLCGYCHHGAGAEEIAAGWYTSLTLLQCEMEVHSLGGGVMVLIPGEAGNIRLPRRVSASAPHLGELDELLRQGKVEEAYRLGDREVLMGGLALGESDLELIRRGIEVLTHWRTSAAAE